MTPVAARQGSWPATITVPAQGSCTRSFPPSAEPETGPGPVAEPDVFPDFLPPGWASGHDDRSFPWS